MNFIVQIYMIVCVILLLFDIVFLMVKNARNHRFYPQMPKFEEVVEKEIKRKMKMDTFSRGFEDKLAKKLSHTKYLISLQGVLEQYPEARSWFKSVIFSCLDSYRKKQDYEQAYYTYVVSTLGFEEKKVPNEFVSEFLEFLDTKSLYTFANTMNAIYEFGQLNILITAIDKVDERAGFYHKKLFVDGMLQAKVDKSELATKLCEYYNKYSDFTKGCILDYLRFANMEVTDFCMNIVKSKTEDSENRYAALRYFVKFPSATSDSYFMNVLKSGSDIWVEEMLAIQGLSRDTDPEVRELIKKKITSRDWYVRVNAAEYLQKNGMDKEEIAEIIAMNDRYTNEALLYQYRDDKEMSEYIMTLLEKGGQEE